jgi:hypothetical protein
MKTHIGKDCLLESNCAFSLNFFKDFLKLFMKTRINMKRLEGVVP